jgi:hypothetical protein
MNDLVIGKQALQYFYDASKSYSAFNFKSFAEFYGVYGNKADIYADGIGLAIRVNDMSDSKVKSTMTSLAKQTQGRVPADHQGYVKALGNTASQINYLDLTATVAKEVGSRVVDGAVAVGDNVIATAKILNYVWPVALLFFLWSWYQMQLPKKGRK